MDTSRRAVCDNLFSKVVFGLTAVLLVFAPSTARPQTLEGNPFSFCNGYFALCAASTCTANPGQMIAVHTLIPGRDRDFPEADCTCPVILGTSVANLSGGNMQGSCEPPGPGELWSSYQIRPDIPQALTNWVPTPPEDLAPPQVCPAFLNLGDQYAQCFSMKCDTETYINNVPVVTCHCAIGATLIGTPAPPNSSFPTQAGQSDRAFCAMHPVGNVLSIR